MAFIHRPLKYFILHWFMSYYTLQCVTLIRQNLSLFLEIVTQLNGLGCYGPKEITEPIMDPVCTLIHHLLLLIFVPLVVFMCERSRMLPRRNETLMMYLLFLHQMQKWGAIITFFFDLPYNLAKFTIEYSIDPANQLLNLFEFVFLVLIITVPIVMTMFRVVFEKYVFLWIGAPLFDTFAVYRLHHLFGDDEAFDYTYVLRDRLAAIWNRL